MSAVDPGVQVVRGGPAAAPGYPQEITRETVIEGERTLLVYKLWTCRKLGPASEVA